MPEQRWDDPLTIEQVDRMFESFERLVRREASGSYLTTLYDVLVRRLCPACRKTRMTLGDYKAKGGTEKQWNDPRVMVVCCNCMGLLSFGFSIEEVIGMYKDHKS